MKRLAAVRLVLAAVLTVVVLPYAWANVYVTPMVRGVPWDWLGWLASTVVAVAALTWQLRPAVSLAVSRWTLGAVAVGWVAALIAVSLTLAEPVGRPVWVFALFLPATLWVPWCAWLGYGGLPPPWKVIVFGGLAWLTVPFPALVRVDGLSGDGKVVFTWRLSSPRGHAGPAAVPAAAALTSVGPPGADDSPQFFGPERNGTWPGVRLADFESAPPRELWRIPVGTGWSGFAAVGGYGFTQEQHGDEECVTCYDLADGSPVWRHGEMTRFTSTMGGDGPRATPTVSGDRVYAVGATGRLVCLDIATGQKVWCVNLLADGGPNLEHGVCASPLVDGERVIVCPPGEDGPALAAFHRDTGEKLWQSGSRRSGYGSPVAWELDGRRMILVMDSDGLAGHDSVTGHPLWHFPWTNHTRVNCSQPVTDAAGPGTVLVSTGYGTGAALVRVHRDGPDRWAAEHHWRRNELKTKFTSPVMLDGHVYGLDDGVLACVDAATGQRRWKDGRYGHGQVIRAADRLVVQAESGDVVLVEASPAGLKELGRVAALGSKTWTVPTLCGRRLVVRNDREAVCYEIAWR